MEKQYVIGLDYGTDSVRAVLIDAADGTEMASSVFWYPRWKNQQYCDASKKQYRQHPLDHIEGLEHTIKTVVTESGVLAHEVKGICVDTTGSSPVPVNKDGVALALLPEFEENPNAMMVLWKDHTAIAEAEEINKISRSWGGEDFTKYEGGIYSSEWFWAKILHIIREDQVILKNAYSWVEHCDLMTYILIGETTLQNFKRSRCAAGHKAMWHEDWNGLPPKIYLDKFHPYLGTLRDRLYNDTYTSDIKAGHLSEDWANRLGLTTETVISVGTFDAHAGAVGARIEKNSLVRVMGTSTCDIIVAPHAVIGNHTVKGICGQVDGSVIPNMVGLEAGQSAFGDVLAWFKDILMWPIEHLVLNSSTLSEEDKARLKEDIDSNLIPTLSQQAANIPIGESVPIALDWINGRRTPDANQNLTSAMTNLSLGTKAPHLFKALIHAICFGSKKIVDRFEEEGVKIDKVIGIGGVARKSPYIMQTLANVLNRPIIVAESDYAPALGAAIYASVASGIYPSVLEASQHLGSSIEAEYYPESSDVELLKPLMEHYDSLASFVENLTQLKTVKKKEYESV